MASPWTEPAVTASVTRTVQVIARGRGVFLDADFPIGAEVRVLLIPKRRD